MFIITVKQ